MRTDRTRKEDYECTCRCFNVEVQHSRLNLRHCLGRVWFGYAPSTRRGGPRLIYINNHVELPDAIGNSSFSVCQQLTVADGYVRTSPGRALTRFVPSQSTVPQGVEEEFGGSVFTAYMVFQTWSSSIKVLNLIPANQVRGPHPLRLRIPECGQAILSIERIMLIAGIIHPMWQQAVGVVIPRRG